MNHDEKKRLEQQTKRRYFLQRFEAGCMALLRDRSKRYILLGYLLLVAVLWLFRVPIFGLGRDDLLAPMKQTGIENLLRLGSIAGLLLLPVLFGMPFGGKAIHDNLRRIGFVNHAGETPRATAFSNRREPGTRN